MYDVFIICPVRNATEEQKEKLKNYIWNLETDGLLVYYPARDTDQSDPNGHNICEANRSAIYNSKSIHIFWDKDSQGSLFDLGMAFMLNKPLHIVNFEDLTPTSMKSFTNVIMAWHNISREY